MVTSLIENVVVAAMSDVMYSWGRDRERVGGERGEMILGGVDSHTHPGSP